MDTFVNAQHLVWTDHDRHITMAFREFLQRKSLTDVSIVCGDKTIPTHKLLLSAASPFFHRIIEENPCKHPIIILDDYPCWVIEMILAFIYCGEIHIPHEAVYGFIEVAKDLEIKGLNFVCEIKIPQISPSQQPRRKQPKPHRLSEQENTNLVAPLDFSVKSNGTSADELHMNEPCTKRQRADNDEWFLENERETEKAPAVKKTKRKENKHGPKTDLLTLPYPTLKPFNANVHLDGLSPKPHLTEIEKEKLTPLREHTPSNNNLPLSYIQRAHQSARGGPPRSWTNQDLLNALDDVWSKRMNTSQAARYHRIPYNSLLMYVRGKYGKTLNIKLNEEQKKANQTVVVPTSSLSPPPLTQMNGTSPVSFLGDESRLRLLLSQSFPQQGSLPPHDLLHNFAVLGKAAAKHNIK